MYSFPTFLPFITVYIIIVRCAQNTIEAFKKKSNACSKSSHQLVPVRGCRTRGGTCRHKCGELCSLHIILSLTRHWETQFLFSSVEKERMSFSLQPSQIWDLILWGSEQRCAGLEVTQGARAAAGAVRSLCCCATGCSPPLLPQSSLGLFSELAELLFFNNQGKQIPCVLLEGPCNETKVNENTNSSRSVSPKHAKQCSKSYQQTVAAGKYSIKQLLHLCEIFVCLKGGCPS